MGDRDSSKVQHLAVYETEAEVKTRSWVELARTFYLVQRKVTAMLTQLEMTLPQFDVMATLAFSEGVTQQELAHRLLVTKGNIVGVIDRLESCGWVQRRPDANDRRANRLHLTAAGKRKIDNVLPRHDRLVVKSFSALSCADAKALRNLLNALAQANQEDD